MGERINQPLKRRESNNIKTINNQMPIYNRKYRTCNYTMEYYIAMQKEWYTTTCKNMST